MTVVYNVLLFVVICFISYFPLKMLSTLFPSIIRILQHFSCTQQFVEELMMLVILISSIEKPGESAVLLPADQMMV